MLALDKLGRELKPGDFIVYGHALGRSAGLKLGRLLTIDNFEEPGYHPPLVNQCFRMRVVGIYDHFGIKPGPNQITKGVLKFPDRCCKVPENEVPETLKALINEAWSKS